MTIRADDDQVKCNAFAMHDETSDRGGLSKLGIEPKSKKLAAQALCHILPLTEGLIR